MSIEVDPIRVMGESMSAAEVERFATNLASNSVLRAEAEKSVAGLSPAAALVAFVAFAAGKGYSFSADQFRETAKAALTAGGKLLSDAELEAVAGRGDAVTQTNVKVIGEAPAMPMSNLYQQWADIIRPKP